MKIYQARQELREAWSAIPFDMAQVSRAISILLALCDYDLVKFSHTGPELIVNNGQEVLGKEK